PLRDAWRTLARRHPVRIYTLHRVTWLCRDGRTVSPDTFRRQMEYVQRRHDVVSLDRAIALLAQGTRLRRPVAAVTFDDGYESVATAAEPTLTSLGMVAACFVCPDIVSVGGTFAHDATCVSRDWLRVMNWPALRTLHKIGWHVGSHTSSHARVSEIHGDALLRELWNPRAALRDEVAPVPVAFAYPFGGRADVTPGAVELARKCGYVAVLADFGGENAPNAADKFFLNRIDIGGGHDPLMWRAMIDGLDFNRWRARR
ncbi:MAG TPA: polysaccharide deacetylase family protein, partial [Gemmatimonadaceae bacterium]